jgi:hypothetical protein
MICGWGIGDPLSWIGPEITAEDLIDPTFPVRKVLGKYRKDALLPPSLYSFRVLPFVIFDFFFAKNLLSFFLCVSVMVLSCQESLS